MESLDRETLGRVGWEAIEMAVNNQIEHPWEAGDALWKENHCIAAEAVRDYVLAQRSATAELDREWCGRLNVDAYREAMKPVYPYFCQTFDGCNDDMKEVNRVAGTYIAQRVLARYAPSGPQPAGVVEAMRAALLGMAKHGPSNKVHGPEYCWCCGWESDKCLGQQRCVRAQAALSALPSAASEGDVNLAAEDRNFTARIMDQREHFRKQSMERYEEINTLTAEREKLRADLNNLENGYSHLQGDIDKLTAERDQLQERFNASNTESQSRLQEAINLSTERDQLRAEVERLRAECQSWCKAYKERVKRFKNEAKRQTKTIATIERECDDYRSEIVALRKERNTLESVNYELTRPSHTPPDPRRVYEGMRVVCTRDIKSDHEDGARTVIPKGVEGTLRLRHGRAFWLDWKSGSVTNSVMIDTPTGKLPYFLDPLPAKPVGAKGEEKLRDWASEPADDVKLIKINAIGPIDKDKSFVFPDGRVHGPVEPSPTPEIELPEANEEGTRQFSDHSIIGFQINSDGDAFYEAVTRDGETIGEYDTPEAAAAALAAIGQGPGAVGLYDKFPAPDERGDWNFSCGSKIYESATGRWNVAAAGHQGVIPCGSPKEALDKLRELMSQGPGAVEAALDYCGPTSVGGLAVHMGESPYAPEPADPPSPPPFDVERAVVMIYSAACMRKPMFQENPDTNVIKWSIDQALAIRAALGGKE